MAEKIVLGLTGNIGTGKSLVLRMLQELGATVIDADKLVHLLMRQGGPMVEAIVNEFGKFVLDDDGQINRNRLGRVVFGMPDALTKLEAITHPAVRQEILKRVDEATTPVVAIEAIKLFESGLAEHCQSNWVISAPPETQLKRLVERRKMAIDQAQQRIKAQSPQQEKEAQADVVIDNSGDLAKTWGLVKKHYMALLQAKSGVAQPTAVESLPTETTDAPEPLSPTAEVNINELTVRRAKRTDLQAMAELIAAGTKGAVDPDLSQMMESLFSRAYLVATSGEHIVGIAGWQTENLIAGLQDFFVLRDDLWPTAGQQMLAKIHDEIDSLSCEVSLIFVLKAAGSAPIEFFKTQGYEEIEGKDLGYMWKDAALEWQPENSILLYKKLRDQRIMVPM